MNEEQVRCLTTEERGAEHYRLKVALPAESEVVCHKVAKSKQSSILTSIQNTDSP
jgi:hypothetical protein